MEKKIYTHWSNEEKLKFKQLYEEYGKNFSKFEEHLPGRSKTMIRSFFYNHHSKSSTNEILSQKDKIEERNNAGGKEAQCVLDEIGRILRDQ